MARLQILELPEGSGDDRPPFVLVVDQMPADASAFEALRCDLGFAVAEQIGARALLVFEDTIDIPANDTTAYRSAPDARQEIVVELAGEDPQGAIDSAIRKAKDGQRLAHGWTDISRGGPRLAKWRDELTDALGMDRTRDWDDIRNAAAGIRKQRDSQAETLERVRNLPERPDAMDSQHPDPEGYLHGYSIAIREAKRVTYPSARTEASETGPALNA